MQVWIQNISLYLKIILALRGGNRQQSPLREHVGGIPIVYINEFR